MSSLAPLRADLLAGDLRCLYLGWLNCVGFCEVDDDVVEPPVPPGLGELTAPLAALADFLRIDGPLMDAAAEASPPLPARGDSAEDLRAWIAALPTGEKDAILYRLTQDAPLVVQRGLMQRLRRDRPPQPPPESGGRTVAELLAAADRKREEQRRLDAERRAREKARRQAEAAWARQEQLDALAEREPQAWREVDALIATRQPRRYDQAVQLLRDLRDLAEREGDSAAAARVNALRAEHSRKHGLIRRLDDAKI
jgi:hypothetical protein